MELWRMSNPRDVSFNISVIELERAIKYAKDSHLNVITFHVTGGQIGDGFAVSETFHSEKTNITDVSTS
jgi:hypothetical protein